MTTPPVSVFGTVVTPDLVEEAMVDTLKTWMPTYLAELERRTSRTPGSVPPPRSYAITNRFSRRPQEQLPACIVISPGTTGTPERSGDGRISAWFRLEVGVAVGADTPENANRLAKQYGGWLVDLILQRPSLGGVAAAVSLQGVDFLAMPADILEVGHCAVCLFDVKVDEIANTDCGPAQPDLNPVDWPEIETVESVHVDIERRSLT